MIEITPIGIFIIPLSVILFFVSERLLYSLLIFFIPFSASAVANISLGNKSSGVMLFTYIAALWIVRILLQIIYRGKLFFPSYQRQSLILLIFFLFVAGMSLIMPVIINGRIELLSPYLGEQIEGVSHPLYLTTFHITRFIYLMIGILFTVFLSIRNSREELIFYTIKLYIISAIFVCIWGWLQQICYFIGKPYPTIFNNSITPSAQGYIAFFEDINVKRISSVTVEPSILAQFLITALPFIIFSIYFDKPIISKNIDRLSLFLIISVLAISTSSTGYFGLIVMLIMIFWVLVLLKQISLGKFSLFFIIFTLIFTLALSNIGIKEVFEVSIASKFGSYSFRERMNSITLAFSYFMRYPLLGLGWGSVTSHDLFVRTLADVGIIGFVVFISVIISILKRLARARIYLIAQCNYQVVFFAGASVAFITLLMVCVFTSFPFVFGHFWFTIGMAIANSSTHIDKKSRFV